MFTFTKEILNGKLHFSCSERYGIQKVLISGLLTTNRLAQDFIENVNKLIKNMCNIEGYCYKNNGAITRANLFKDGLHLQGNWQVDFSR